MLDLYITIRDKNPEVMILDRNLIRTRLHFWINRERNHPLIIYVNCDWIFKKTAQHRRSVTLKLGYELNFLHKT